MTHGSTKNALPWQEGGYPPARYEFEGETVRRSACVPAATLSELAMIQELAWLISAVVWPRAGIARVATRTPSKGLLGSAQKRKLCPQNFVPPKGLTPWRGSE